MGTLWRSDGAGNWDRIGASASVQLPASGAKLSLSANFSVANPSAKISWSAADFDTDGFFSAANPTRLTIPVGKAGKYVVAATVGISQQTGGTRNVSILKNNAGQHIEAAATPSTADATRQTISGVLDLAEGDYVEVSVYHNAGAAVTVESSFSSFSLTPIPGKSAILVGPQAPALGAKVTNSVDQTFSTGGATNLIAFNTVVRDDMGAWTSGANTRLTATTAGWYQIRASAYMGQGSVTSYRQLALRKNGSTFIATTLQDNSSAAYDTEQEVTCLEYMNVGDYVEAVVFFSGAALTVTMLASGRSPSLAMARVPGAQGAALSVTNTLPLNPVDGQECYFLADATNSIIWHLKYRAASTSAYKWGCIGGGSLYSAIPDQNAMAADGTWHDHATMIGPDIVFPLAGDYAYTASCSMYNNSGANQVLSAGIAAPGGTPAALDTQTVYETVAVQFMPLAWNGLLSGLTAGATRRMRYYASGPGGGFLTTQLRRFEARPIRVG